MEELNVTLSLFFEIRDAEIFGGTGKNGYSKSELDLCVRNLEGFNLALYAQDQIKIVAELCKAAQKKINIITREEYEENMERGSPLYNDQKWEN